jgi:hypothetical protein
MRPTVQVVGVLGGVIAVVGGIAALIVGGADTVVAGGLLTAVAGAIAILGAVLAGRRPGLAAVLLIVAFVVAGLVAPGVIPALADSVIVFFAYLVGLVLLLAGAIVAVRERNAAPTGTPTRLGH